MNRTFAAAFAAFALLSTSVLASPRNHQPRTPARTTGGASGASASGSGRAAAANPKVGTHHENKFKKGHKAGASGANSRRGAR